METLKHFEIYISAQKATGMQFIVFGLLLLLVAALLHFSQLNPIAQGLRNGLFVIGLLLLASGGGFMISQHKLLKTGTATYHTDRQEFKQQEIERMKGVDENVPTIVKSLCVLLILMLLALIFFSIQPMWKGILFSVLIYLVGLLILESISYLSVKTYLQTLFNN